VSFLGNTLSTVWLLGLDELIGILSPGHHSARALCLCGGRRYTSIMLRIRSLSAGFIPPCLPTKANVPPSGGLWVHEIKHDGFRIIARKDGARVRLYSRPGNDDRFPLIVEALARLQSRSCIIDGEAVACDENGVASFDRIRYRRHDGKVFLYAFDLIELDGRCPFKLGLWEMDAKTTHVLVLLAALSLVCTALAWAVDHAVFSSVFAALAAVAVLGITPRERD
jgi:hypothetical protein